jgi:hypothetical protein
VTIFIQYGNLKPQQITQPNLKHLPITSFFSFTLGQDYFTPSYPVFNGQFVNPVFGIGKGAYINTMDQFNVLSQQTSKPPLDYWATASAVNYPLIDQVVTYKGQNPSKQDYAKFDIACQLPEEYAFSGWFRWIDIPD